MSISVNIIQKQKDDYMQQLQNVLHPLNDYKQSQFIQSIFQPSISKILTQIEDIADDSEQQFIQIKDFFIIFILQSQSNFVQDYSNYIPLFCSYLDMLTIFVQVANLLVDIDNCKEYKKCKYLIDNYVATSIEIGSQLEQLCIDFLSQNDFQNINSSIKTVFDDTNKLFDQLQQASIALHTTIETLQVTQSIINQLRQQINQSYALQKQKELAKYNGFQPYAAPNSIDTISPKHNSAF